MNPTYSVLQVTFRGSPQGHWLEPHKVLRRTFLARSVESWWLVWGLSVWCRMVLPLSFPPALLSCPGSSNVHQQQNTFSPSVLASYNYLEVSEVLDGARQYCSLTDDHRHVDYRHVERRLETKFWIHQLQRFTRLSSLSKSEKIAQSLIHRHSATSWSRITQFYQNAQKLTGNWQILNIVIKYSSFGIW